MSHPTLFDVLSHRLDDRWEGRNDNWNAGDKRWSIREISLLTLLTLPGLVHAFICSFDSNQRHSRNHDYWKTFFLSRLGFMANISLINSLSCCFLYFYHLLYNLEKEKWSGTSVFNYGFKRRNKISVDMY